MWRSFERVVRYPSRMRHNNSHALPLRRKMTKAEVILWSRLRRNAMHGLRIRRQHPVGPYIADFACLPLRIVIEVDGATHGSAEELAHDRRREDYFRKHGFRVLRFWNADVYENLNGVLQAIWIAMDEEIARRCLRSRSLPSPLGDSGAGEVVRSTLDLPPPLVAGDVLRSTFDLPPPLVAGVVLRSRGGGD